MAALWRFAIRTATYDICYIPDGLRRRMPLSGTGPFGDGDDAVHLAQHRFLDELAVDHHQLRVGGVEPGDDAPRPRDAFGRRCEHGVIAESVPVGLYFGPNPKSSPLRRQAPGDEGV